jgi:hypothetical protein
VILTQAQLEGLITSETISGFQMYVGEGRRPNNLTIVITANGATMSKDMAQRVNVLKLGRPTYDQGDWDDQLSRFVDAHRLEILGDLKLFFDRERQCVGTANRWGSWQQAIVSRLDDPQMVQTGLRTRGQAVDADDSEVELMRDAFRCLIRRELLHCSPDRAKVKISAHAIADLARLVTRENKATNKMTAYVNQLEIPELSGQTRGGGRFRYWIGTQANPDAEVMAIIQKLPDGFRVECDEGQTSDASDGSDCCAPL